MMAVAQQELEADLDAASRLETPDSALCLRIAHEYARRQDHQNAYRWIARVVDVSDRFLDWSAAAALLGRIAALERPRVRRQARVAITGSYTLDQLTSLVQLAALREGVDLDVFQGRFGHYQQDLLQQDSQLYSFAPSHIVLAVHSGELRLSSLSRAPEEEVSAEVQRWQSLWQMAQQRANATVIQHLFALRPEDSLGHLSSRLPGSRRSMMVELNRRLAQSAPPGVSTVDIERLAADFGKRRWFDDRYWHMAKQMASLDALPVIARHTAAVLAASLGLSRKCLVLDLDGTLWGGVIGEDGLEGIRLGNGSEGEAFVAFQSHLLELKSRGVILAVASKNADSNARLPFERHPDMRIKLDDIAVFRANWEDKPTNLRAIARELNLGLDALTFVDDNIAERQLVRQVLPEVDVIILPSEPSSYVRTMSDYLRFEPANVTEEDLKRTEQYRARAAIEQLRGSSTSVDDFLRNLGMKALIAPFDELHLPRIAQLIGKTNQFNLTGQRYSTDQLRRVMEDPKVIHLYLRLKDRYADHGLVSVLIARCDQGVAQVESWLMSCRVFGRNVERRMFDELCRRAIELGCSAMYGSYVPSGRNEVVSDLYSRLGFRRTSASPELERWRLDFDKWTPLSRVYIDTWDAE